MAKNNYRDPDHSRRSTTDEPPANEQAFRLPAPVFRRAAWACPTLIFLLCSQAGKSCRDAGTAEAGDGGWAGRADGTFVGHSLTANTISTAIWAETVFLGGTTRNEKPSRRRRDSRPVQDLDLHRHPCRSDSPGCRAALSARVVEVSSGLGLRSHLSSSPSVSPSSCGVLVPITHASSR